MSDESEPAVSNPLPTSYAVGDNLAWDSPLIRVHLVTELPFWMMLPTSIINITHAGTHFRIMLSEADAEVFAFELTDNRRSCGYQGNNPESFESRPEMRSIAPFIRRKQRTTIYFEAYVHEGIETALVDPKNHRVASSYFASLCEAHIPVINEVISRYRLLTYDYFAYEVAAWDVPVWHIRGGRLGHVAVPLFDYISIAGRPMIQGLPSATGERPDGHPLELTTGEQIEQAVGLSGTPGERDLLDARNLMERGDYAGAVRRTTTAIEVLVEHVLRNELMKLYDSATVDQRLEASKNDFPGRFRQWQSLSGITLKDSRQRSIETTRQLRHEIVHQGRRLTHEDRLLAQELTDKGRWTFNHIENDPVRRDLREKNNVVRSLLRPTLAFRFPVMNTSEGLRVASLRSVLPGMTDK
jgi:hypothetical protein